MTDWRIAPLTPHRVTDLAACHIASWREAYETLVPAHILDGFDLDRSAVAWERRRAAGTHRLPVALVDDVLVGFASATFPVTRRGPVTPDYPPRPNHHAAGVDRVIAPDNHTDGPDHRAHGANPTAEHTELEALYVREDWHGTGLADALLEAAGSPHTLWVFADYPRAQAFYRRHGFADTGIRRTDPFTLLPEQFWRR